MVEINSQAYNWINAVPSAIAVLDAFDLSLIAKNSLYGELGEGVEDELRASLGAALKAETVIMADAGGEEKPYIARAQTCGIGGRDCVVFALIAAVENAPRRDKSGGVIDFEDAKKLLDELLSQPDASTAVCAIALEEPRDEDQSRRVTTILKSCMRQSDVLAKKGGGEFLMIFPKCRAKIVESIMENVKERFDAVGKAEGMGGIKTRHAIIEAAFGKYGTGEQLLAAVVAERDAERSSRF